MKGPFDPFSTDDVEQITRKGDAEGVFHPPSIPGSITWHCQSGRVSRLKSGLQWTTYNIQQKHEVDGEPHVAGEEDSSLRCGKDRNTASRIRPRCPERRTIFGTVLPKSGKSSWISPRHIVPLSGFAACGAQHNTCYHTRPHMEDRWRRRDVL